MIYEERIMEKILKDDSYTAGALVGMYARQEEDEKMGECTTHENGVGFNAYDAKFLTNLAKQVLHRKSLTRKQISAARKALQKYKAQLCTMNLQPIQINSFEAKTQKIETKKKSIELTHNNKGLLVRFDYDPTLVQKIKESLPQRAWKPDLKAWLVPNDKVSRKVLQNMGFEIEIDCKTHHDVPIEQVLQDLNMKSELKPFQKEGLKFLLEKQGNALLADDMGLGKTVQAIAWIAANPEQGPFIIVCPASLKSVWKREFKKHTNLKVRVASGLQPRYVNFSEDNILIINYRLLGHKTKKGKNGEKPIFPWVEFLLSKKAKTVVFDEAHYIKNPGANRTQAAKELTRYLTNKIFLTGTPIENRPMELFTVMDILMPKDFYVFHHAHAFGRRYCAAKHNGFGWDYTGASKTKELHEILTEHIMLRRKKEDVLKELPAKTRITIPIELSPVAMKKYKAAEKDFLRWVYENLGSDKAEKAARAETLTRITALKRLAAEAKLNDCLAWIDNYLDSSGKKLVTFCNSTFVAEKLHEKFKENSVLYVGATSASDREKAEIAFQNDETTKLFIGNMKSAGVGITLTKADTVAFLELGWNPSVHNQAEDRIHRIGQDSEKVFAYYLIAEDSIEEDILDLIDEKRKVIDKIIEGNDEVDENSLIGELLQKIKNKRKRGF